jgi:hypothetical protein
MILCYNSFNSTVIRPPELVEKVKAKIEAIVARYKLPLTRGIASARHPGGDIKYLSENPAEAAPTPPNCRAWEPGQLVFG